jgi:hypothetical protein
MAGANFQKNVFINCPFDDNYFPLLKTLLYTLRRLGLFPRLALERFDSGEVRLQKIKELIECSQYSIHDLSRFKSTVKNEYFRLNMPFELGLDLGCRYYKVDDASYQEKKILILEKEKYSTQKALSDLSFADCKCHKGEAEELVLEVRNWFAELGFKDLPSGTSIWDDYNVFYFELYAEKEKEGFKEKDINRLPIPEFLNWINSKINQ